jgi:hypothetical protein
MGILIYRSVYVQKVLKKFNMDKTYALRTPMLVRALEKDTDKFIMKQEGEEVLGPEYSYLSVIGALMHLTNNIRPDIAFVVNCLTRKCFLDDIKNILRYLHDMTDPGLFFRKNQDLRLIRYMDAGYLSNP